ncbi:MAG: RNA polymerase sigma factor [Spirosomataceae bacterium]
MQDKQIWQGLNQKDTKTFEHIYDVFYSDLIRYGWKICGNREVVKEAIQDMMVELYERKSSFQSEGKIKPYLFASLRNKLYDQLKKKPNDVWNDSIDAAFSVSNIFEWMIGEEAIEQDTRKVHQVIAALPPKQREVIHLRFYENVSLPEIAKIMQINYQSVQNLLQRSLKSLSENLVIQEIKKGGTLFFQFIYLGKIRTHFFKIST